MKELIKIQNELKAPKKHKNAFLKSNYRNAEDILEALKPLMLENNCYLTLSDEVKVIGERYYVNATATIYNNEGVSVSVSAYAREDAEKRGVDGAQITGAASSYARKYALNGLFAIDDTDDSDVIQAKVKPSISDDRLQGGIDKVINGSLPKDAFLKSLDIVELTEEQKEKISNL